MQFPGLQFLRHACNPLGRQRGCGGHRHRHCRRECGFHQATFRRAGIDIGRRRARQRGSGGLGEQHRLAVAIVARDPFNAPGARRGPTQRRMIHVEPMRAAGIDDRAQQRRIDTDQWKLETVAAPGDR